MLSGAISTIWQALCYSVCVQLRPLRLLRLLAVCGLIGFSLTQLSACGLVPGLDLPSGQEGDNGPPSTGDQDGNGGTSVPGAPNGGGTSTGGTQGYPEQHQREPEPVGGAAGQLGDDPPAEEPPSDEMEEGEDEWAEFF